MSTHNPYKIIIGESWFDAPYIRSLLDAESPERIKDIEGPESDALIEFAGWSFIEEPLHVVLVDSNVKSLAVAWIAATTRGLNLTYIVAESAAGKGLAARAVAQSVIAYSEYRNTSKPNLTVHAQYELENHASARVAERLGLVINPELAFNVHEARRQFIGGEAAWGEVITRAKLIVP